MPTYKKKKNYRTKIIEEETTAESIKCNFFGDVPADQWDIDQLYNESSLQFEKQQQFTKKYGKMYINLSIVIGNNHS
jgi:hypothetical protein